MNLSRLNERGLSAFGEYLRALAAEPTTEVPWQILADENLSEEACGGVVTVEKAFGSRMEVASYLDELLQNVEDVASDRGLWGWLSLRYFNSTCPLEDSGERRPGALSRHIPEPGDFRKYYRHLLAGPLMIYRAHKDDPARAHALLCTPVSKPGDIVEQLASRQELVTNRAIVKLATKLYVEGYPARPKRGASGRGRGSVRRFAKVLNQMDLTWDLYSMSDQQLLELLPGEFDRFVTS